MNKISKLLSVFTIVISFGTMAKGQSPQVCANLMSGYHGASAGLANLMSAADVGGCQLVAIKQTKVLIDATYNEIKSLGCPFTPLPFYATVAGSDPNLPNWSHAGQVLAAARDALEQATFQSGVDPKIYGLYYVGYDAAHIVEIVGNFSYFKGASCAQAGITLQAYTPISAR